MFWPKRIVSFWFSSSLDMASSAPPNFSWVEKGKVAGLALPRMTSQYQFLLDNGIKHLVCLCERKPPNYDTCPQLNLHHIKIVDFTPPSASQIEMFLNIVEEANSKGEVRIHMCWAFHVFKVVKLFQGCPGQWYAWNHTSLAHLTQPV